MSETSLKFGPKWLRALVAQSNSSPAVPQCQVAEVPPPKYKLADYRYGREEMLALIPKDLQMPEQLLEYDYLMVESAQKPLALLPISEEEQRIMARSVNSELALRGKAPAPTGTVSNRGRGGGVMDRGRGRGRGGFYHRGTSFEENDEVQPGSFPWNRSLERSNSTNEKDQRWEERDRRFDRPGYTGRTGSSFEDPAAHIKQEPSRAPNDSWRKPCEKEDDSGWRTANSRGTDKFGGRGSWRSHSERNRNRHDSEGKDKSGQVLNGPSKSISNRQRLLSGHSWEDNMAGDNLPEWSVEEPAAVTDVVGTFDASGAFLETKIANTNMSCSDTYLSEEDVKMKNVSPEKTPPGKSKVKKGKSPVTVPVAPVAKSAQDTAKITVSPVQNHFPASVEKENKIVPQIVSMEQKSKLRCAEETHQKPPKELCKKRVVLPEVPASAEEDTFAHHKKATETMVARWTEEEEQCVITKVVEKPSILPPQDENSQKWFYRDPQGLVQGPFSSTEMSDWFNLGYFTMDLLVKRGCDERFTRLGELMQTWGRIPFVTGQSPPSVNAVPVASTTHSTPLSETLTQIQAPNTQPVAAQLPQSDAQIRLMREQMVHQLLQQELLRQAQVLSHIKQQETFANLTPQQQNQLLHQLLAQQQQQQQQLIRPPAGAIEQQPHDIPPPLPFPLMGLAQASATSLMKHEIPMSWRGHNPAAWPLSQMANQQQPGSIWDTDPPTIKAIEVSELEKKLAAEEDEKRRLAMLAVKRLEEEKKHMEEEKQKEEELKRKQEEELLLKELQKQEEEKRRLAEEEKRRLEEIQRLKEQEMRRQEEIKRMEERRKEEEMQLRKQEELRRLEEQRQAEIKEQKRREQLQREELRRMEEDRKIREDMMQQYQEQERQREMQRIKEQEMQMLKEQEMQRLKEQEMQRLKEQELQKMEEEMAQLSEPKGPVWSLPTIERKSNELSLADIQIIQEQKEREEQKQRLKLQQQIQQQQFIQQQQQCLKQAQANKNGLSWAKRSDDPCRLVKSLADIQQEEAEKLATQQKVVKTAATTVQAMAATAGVWGNSSQMSRIASNQGWGNSNSCFWDDAVKSTAASKNTKTNDSAFPSLANSIKPANMGSNKNKNVRAKKDEDAVLKLFETHRKPTDEFTSWCTDALSNLPSSVDVPTFVAFLKDVESPYEVHDYVKSYLGEGKEAKDFAKQFLERRSKYRNQAKQTPAEENMWGPAPALTPSVNKPINQTVNDCDANICNKGKAKKKKNRMQKLDSSMLGFTVQPNSDRLNVGEIDHVEGM